MGSYAEDRSTDEVASPESSKTEDPEGNKTETPATTPVGAAQTYISGMTVAFGKYDEGADADGPDNGDPNDAVTPPIMKSWTSTKPFLENSFLELRTFSLCHSSGCCLRFFLCLLGTGHEGPCLPIFQGEPKREATHRHIATQFVEDPNASSLFQCFFICALQMRREIALKPSKVLAKRSSTKLLGHVVRIHTYLIRHQHPLPRPVKLTQLTTRGPDLPPGDQGPGEDHLVL